MQKILVSVEEDMKKISKAKKVKSGGKIASSGDAVFDGYI